MPKFIRAGSRGLHSIASKRHKTVTGETDFVAMLIDSESA